MGIRIFIFILVLGFSGVVSAETIDITQDLEKQVVKNPQQKAGVPGAQAGSSQADSMQDIHDIKPLEDIGYDNRIIYIIVGIVALFFIIGLLFLIIDHYIRKRKKIPDMDVPDIPPDQEAYSFLDQLEKDTAIDMREYYFRLTAILKRYLGRRFGVDAPEMTIEELLPKVQGFDMDKGLKPELKSFLTAAEPVKFAGVTVVQEKMTADLAFVRSFIEKTPVISVETEGEVTKNDV